ncbi:PQQ-dependent sugar dehydrogenase [Kibdelosporangium philippinense]|uniref:PQQ-dependent sugar dehydrogenase n=2 Tax=Kibdelosporangium philippinense TaxID=211113 RepID=A0ABS8ZX46_9PSEU|nr:LamG-like jellyroll fold domain-containing protein [Kibdelosporangium philippinense]MCE7011908.1 PQQ-dependent sugar dehydrogenase [Kibdelosporangium philippinense]
MLAFSLAPLVVLPAAEALALPAGFTEQTILRNLEAPMAVDFSEDGRVFVAEKSGVIKVFDGLGDTTPTVFADMRTKVYNELDRGMMGLALAPGFPADPSVYVLYAHDAAIGATAPRWGSPNATSDSCPNPPGATGDGCVISGRLSRLDATSGAEQVLIEDWCQQYPSHSVGDLKFGPDGYLYASGGDGASFNWADYGQAGSPKNPCGDPPVPVGGTQSPPTAEGGALRSQDYQTMSDPMGLDGTVIRIDPATGQGAPGNPMISSTDANARRVVAAGLRNPFRFAFRPGTSEIWAGDVGWGTWEEVNRITNPIDGSIDNFGWPCMEGNQRSGGYNFGLTMCERIYSGAVPHTPPYYTYNHADPVVPGDGCSDATGSSVSGAAFYNKDSYPAQYKGALFFADYSRRCIWTMFPGPDGAPNPANRIVFKNDAFAVDLKIGPNGDLFYVDIAAGEVRRFRYNSGNQPPVASITANPTQGHLPLTVSFSAAASNDPEGSTLSYAWDLDGDGNFNDGTGATISRTYTTAKVYNAAVRVSDPGGLSDVASKQIFAGTRPPNVTINTPSTSWAVGDTVNFSGTAVDPEEGALPASALNWNVVLHHCPTIDNCHQHELTSFPGVSSGSFAAPDHEYPAYLELRLTATDQTGAVAKASKRLDPRVSTVRIETNPPGLTATASGKSGPAPFTLQAIHGSRLSLSAAQTQVSGSDTYEFQNWSHGGPRVQDVFVGTSDTTYRADFVRVSGGDPSLVAAYSFDDGSGTELIDRTGKGHKGVVSGASWAAGHTGGGLSFDGVDDLVTIADAADLRLTNAMTLEAWVRPAAVTAWRTVILKERPDNLSYGLYSSGPGFASAWFTSSGGDRFVNGPNLPANAWSHLAVTYDATTLRLFVNGEQVATAPAAGPMITSTSPLRLGGNLLWNEYFSGQMDDVRVYNRSLSAAEVLANKDIPVAGDGVPPTAPAGLTATPGAGTVSLSWAASTDNVGVTGYDVHRMVNSGTAPGPTNKVATVTATTFSDTGLAAGQYYYRVIARDGSGNSSAPSNQASAVVTADSTPPTVSVTAPASGATVSGTVNVTANAADSGGVAGVQFRVDGVNAGAEDTVAPYALSWNSGSVGNGAHQITAVARDAVGNTATSTPVSVTVNNSGPPPPVAAYNFNEGSGSTLTDRTGGGHTGVVSGATWGAGRNGGALSFDGVNDLVTVEDSNLLDLTNGMTLSAWVRPSSGAAAWRTVLLKERTDGLAYGLYSDNGASRPSAWLRVGADDRFVDGTAAVPANTWTHLAVTYDATTIRLYVNGNQVATVPSAGSMTVSGNPLRIGGNLIWGEYFGGLIDDIRIYNRPLSATEIGTDQNTPVA